MNPTCQDCAFRRGNVCQQVTSGPASVNHLTKCPAHLWPGDAQPPSPEEPDLRIAPFRSGPRPWEGSAPWKNKQVSVLLPILEYTDTLPLVLEGIRRQSVSSIVYLIDTGSIHTTQQILSLRDHQTEVLQIRTQGWYHTSWPVAAALDAAWACVNTPYAFLTHNDCFIKKQTAFEELLPLAARHKAVGHQLTYRDQDAWPICFGHTFLMLDVVEMDNLNITWNMRAYSQASGSSINPDKCRFGYPDTECMMNYQLHKAGLIPSFEAKEGQPLLIGTERNFHRNQDEWMDHCRSMTCGFAYSPEVYRRSMAWVAVAMTEAKERMASWK